VTYVLDIVHDGHAYHTLNTDADADAAVFYVFVRDVLSQPDLTGRPANWDPTTSPHWGQLFTAFQGYAVPTTVADLRLKLNLKSDIVFLFLQIFTTTELNSMDMHSDTAFRTQFKTVYSDFCTTPTPTPVPVDKVIYCMKMLQKVAESMRNDDMGWLVNASTVPFFKRLVTNTFWQPPVDDLLHTAQYLDYVLALVPECNPIPRMFTAFRGLTVHSARMLVNQMQSFVASIPEGGESAMRTIVTAFATNRFNKAEVDAVQLFVYIVFGASLQQDSATQETENPFITAIRAGKPRSLHASDFDTPLGELLALRFPDQVRSIRKQLTKKNRRWRPAFLRNGGSRRRRRRRRTATARGSGRKNLKRPRTRQQEYRRAPRRR